VTRASDFAQRALAACILEPPLLAPAGSNAPWWHALARDFATRPDPFTLGAADRVRVKSTAAGDIVLRTLGSCLVGSVAVPTGYHPIALWRALQDRAFYGSLADRRDADAVFATPPSRVWIERKPAKHPLFTPRDGTCEDVRFESPFVPMNPRERKDYLSHDRNRMAHARYWRHRGPPRSTIIAIHGFSADFYHFNEWFFSIPWLYRSGFDILLATMPFHGQRQTRWSPFSGAGFFAGGAGRINEAFAQSVLDLRIFVGHILDAGAPAVGVTGMSLGGLATSLLASVDKRLAFAIPNVPVVSLADLMLEWEPIATFVRGALTVTRSDISVLRHMLAISSPLTYAPRVPRDRLFIIGGVGDRLAPPRQSRLLWDHWGRCRLHWFPGSHVVHLDRGEYFRATRRFFADVGFRPRRAA
jgi:hypothetical protein